MRRVILSLGLTAACIVAGGMVAMAATSTGHAKATVVSRLEGTVVWPSGKRPAPAFALRDQTGRLISRGSLRGKVWAITFLDSRCTKACPLEGHSLGYVQRALGRRYPLKILIVSVLPQYDTPAHVRAFARKVGLSGDWHWLLGTRRQLAPVWGAYGIGVVTGITHDTAVYLVDRRGDVRVADAVPFVPSQLEASVRALLGH